VAHQAEEFQILADEVKQTDLANIRAVKELMALNESQNALEARQKTMDDTLEIMAQQQKTMLEQLQGVSNYLGQKMKGAPQPHINTQSRAMQMQTRLNMMEQQIGELETEASRLVSESLPDPIAGIAEILKLHQDALASLDQEATDLDRLVQRLEANFGVRQ